MRVLWTLFKAALVLAIGIPVGLFVIATGLGLVATVFALVRIAMRLAVLGLVGYGFYRAARWMFGSRPGRPATSTIAATQLPPADPYYAAAMRELDAELRT